jgi:hypothetical protein
MSAELALLTKVSNDIKNINVGATSPILSSYSISMNQGGYAEVTIENYFSDLSYTINVDDPTKCTIKVVGNTIQIYGAEVLVDTAINISVVATVSGFAPSSPATIALSIFHVGVTGDEAISIASFKDDTAFSSGWSL